MNNKTPSQRGGARKGAGRKPVTNPLKTRAIRLSDDDWIKLKAIGMARLREFINQECPDKRPLFFDTPSGSDAFYELYQDSLKK